MDFYTTSLVVGAGGLALMGVTGLGRHGHSGHVGHGHGGHAHLGHGHAGQGGHTHAAHGHAHAGDHGSAFGRYALAITSPRILFSLFLGFGTAGLILQPILGGIFLLAAALVGAVAFERFIVTPLWDFAMRFASRPALTLESAISEEATAVTNFDANGQGLISVELDGQVVQILGTLTPADREMGARVPAGTRVRIEDVDTARNCCTVSVR